MSPPYPIWLLIISSRGEPHSIPAPKGRGRWGCSALVGLSLSDSAVPRRCKRALLLLPFSTNKRHNRICRQISLTRECFVYRACELHQITLVSLRGRLSGKKAREKLKAVSFPSRFALVCQSLSSFYLSIYPKLGVGRALLYKVLYGETRPRCLSPCRSVYHFDEKRQPPKGPTVHDPDLAKVLLLWIPGGLKEGVLRTVAYTGGLRPKWVGISQVNVSVVVTN